ncbi:MAG TPA: NifU N-terminal domain-containing protein [Acidimicrobiia bacterium]|nr:NifU N-terminal domain-containing protein [Acidimicrobiia bacterium]
MPEATPNPRTIRFVTGPIHVGSSRWYASAEGVDDPRVARLFAEFEDVDNVLVGADFVAVGLRRPDRWAPLLVDVLRVVEAEFVGSEVTSAGAPPEPSRPVAQPHPRKDSAVERAWRALDSADSDEIVAALSSPQVAERQVAARLVGDADVAVAYAAWKRLLDDPSRIVRRAAIDAMVDAQRDELRPLLERALADTDAWIRWKALTGLITLGIEPSRDLVTPLANDHDFRIRLEVTRALRSPNAN